ncbi:TonB-linked SusC/RagA family outer membrane protein [Sphingobacterium yanglingense]|uniref:TonB-linked SusC/RagA family outer membrane protein n=2 Tax=Sphingobacterium yanglingense TaxID=1437280 RepID=A0A4V3DE89_9SPHI|nr:TonB-linked SusC/RagA family outer membrane protein [Sphingobacterium yanglingense]
MCIVGFYDVDSLGLLLQGKFKFMNLRNLDKVRTLLWRCIARFVTCKPTGIGVIMKLIIFLTFAFSLQASASLLAQRVSLSVKKGNLKSVLTELRKQSGYSFIYSDQDFKDAKPVDFEVKEKDILEVLPVLFAGQPLTYTVNGKLISLNRQVAKTKTDVVGMKADEASDLQQRITGKVVDENGRPLAGVTISVQGQRAGAVTDGNGVFALTVGSSEVSLLVTYVGYQSRTLRAMANMETIVLSPQESTLEEATVQINTGYQTVSKERMTGAFGYVSGEQLERKLATGIKNALEGQISGLVIDRTGNVEIRGVSTFTAQMTPLLVVDGYPIEGRLEDLNPMNISSVTVLKDGVAASIYGSRAANGVIVVTTKNGLSGKPRLHYSGFFNAVQRPNLRRLNKASSADYIDAEIELFNLDPDAASPMDSYNMSRVTYLLMQVREGKITEEEANREIESLKKVDGLKQIEQAFFRPETNHQHNIGIGGGSEEYTYNIAVNYLASQQNIINNHSKRLTFDLKNEWKPFSFLTAGASANFVVNNSESSSMLVTNQWGTNPVGYDFSALTSWSLQTMLQPYTNLWDEAGNPAPVWGLSQYKEETYRNTPGMKRWDYNPIEDFDKSRYTGKSFSSRITGFLRAQLLAGLTAEIGGNWEKGNTLTQGFQSGDAYDIRIAYNDATSRSNPALHYLPEGGVINENRNLNESWTLRSQLNYNTILGEGKHRIHALFGNEVRKLTFDNNELASRFGYNPIAGSFIPVNIKDYLGGLYDSDMLFEATFPGMTNGEFKYRDTRFVSWYGNSSYEYDNRFILSGSIRMDMTNFFGTSKKYRYKPMWSLGGTYKLSNEKFWDSELVNKLFVRGSYGINGNISLNNGPSMILRAGSYSPTTGGIAYNVASPPNDQLRWEKTTIANIGIDFGLFKNRVEGSFDYYNKESTDLLTGDAIDPTFGYGSLVRNVGAMRNHGIELGLNVRVVEGTDFRWMVSPNVSLNINKVNYYRVNRTSPIHLTAGAGVLVEGYPATSLWGYKFAGLNDIGQTQVYNKDGQIILIGGAKIPDMVYQGTLRPKWDMALTNNFTYKDLNLSFMMIAKLGHKYRKDGFAGSNIQTRTVGQRWNPESSTNNTIYPVLQSWNMDMFYFPFIDRLIGNASYAKLRDVTLTYDLSRYTKSLHIPNAQVYVQGRNLFYVTAKGVDIDPETAEQNISGGATYEKEQSFSSLPVPREFFIGLKIGF